MSDILESVSGGDAAGGLAPQGTLLDQIRELLSASGETVPEEAQPLQEGQPLTETEILEQILISEQHQEQQLEACISILLVFLMVGLLNYIYKFFRIFF